MIEYLYHYTSIENLALILKYRKIRFTSLNRVDDLEEVITNDYGDLGRFCFVSCWTDYPVESIPLWHMYTPDMKGVRIRLPIYPFKLYVIKKGRYHCSEDIESYINFEDHYKNNSYVINPPFKDILNQIEYTDDLNLLNPKVFYTEINRETKATTQTIMLAPLGKYKRTVWQFQKEWRYRIIICPWKLTELAASTTQEHQEIFSRLKSNTLPFDTYDLDLDPEKIKDMEVVIGPKATESEEIIINSLIQQYNPTAIVKKSNLTLR
ncbi:MAG: DUF2971 domain-containing protein [Halanaerobiales bacterium]|nr:DUF2971 domain-containing protein [Halanaerobiales bacterium]